MLIYFSQLAKSKIIFPLRILYQRALSLISYIFFAVKDVTLVMWAAPANTLLLDVRSTWEVINSSIFKHLTNDKVCEKACNIDSFITLDSARTVYELEVKEGRHIKLGKPRFECTKKLKSRDSAGLTSHAHFLYL